MKPRNSHALLAAVCTAWIGLSAPAGAGSSKVVVELFTSQSCSSCPAADKLLGELAKDSSVLPISLSVDYWDYLGWKDTLALPGHAKRQRAYALRRGDRAVLRLGRELPVEDVHFNNVPALSRSPSTPDVHRFRTPVPTGTPDPVRLEIYWRADRFPGLQPGSGATESKP